MADSEAIVAAARACVGTRFRAQGRSVGLGLDCVGVAAVAMRAGGVRTRVPGDYRLSGDHHRLAERIDAVAGLERVAMAGPGDLVLCVVGRSHRHLAVMTDSGFVHAHLGLGRVVETPGVPEWPIEAAWRVKGD